MPPREDKEIVLFVTNIGQQPADGDPDFFEKAKQVMKLIIQKKILTRPKDEVQIMLLGAKRNGTNDRYATIEQPCRIPTWDFLRCVSDMEKSRESCDDWPKSVLEALRQTQLFPPKAHVIVILLLDCGPRSSYLDLLKTDNAAKNSEERNVDLLWIGGKPLDDLSPGELNEGERALMDILKNGYRGEYATLDKALESLRIIKIHRSRHMAWRCDLTVGNIAIPASTYVQATEDDKRPSFQTVNVRIGSDGEEKTTIVRAEREYVDRHREACPVTDTISGYMYGRKFIPVSESDARGMNENKNVKSMLVYGFVSQGSIELEDLAGNSSRIVIPDGPLAEKPFYCLVRAMADGGYAAVVRKVYNGRANPKMNILFPRMDVPGEPWCLGMIESVYAEDRRVVQPRSLKSVTRKLRDGQLRVAEDFIDSMMLIDPREEKNDLFDPGTVHSPSLQHLWNSLAHRALNPDVPLPPMDEALEKLLRTPDRIKAEAKPLLSRLKELFPKKVERNAPIDKENTVRARADAPSDATKVETKLEDITGESISHPDEAGVDLDELFDADMDT